MLNPHGPIPGVYESLVTEALAGALADPTLAPLALVRHVEAGEVGSRLHSYLAATIRTQLERQATDEDRIALAQRLLTVLAEQHAESDREADDAEFLLQVEHSSQAPQLRQLEQLREPAPATGATVVPFQRPETPFSDVGLITHTGSGPNLAAELRKELDSADRVDLLMAFVKWSGLRTIQDALTAFRARGGTLRVITTVYVGASERAAIDALVRDFGAEVRVDYGKHSTRLHAKAWLFHRDSGFSTAYVGSSNLSQSAMLAGLEWNVRLSNIATPELLRTFHATFNTLWEDVHVEAYDPDRDGEKLTRALQDASFTSSGQGRGATGGELTVDVSGLDVNPYPHQTIMLEDLTAERVEHNRHRNLVVAATGTGKTVIAALDYRTLAQTWQQSRGRGLPRLLFIAHRAEILTQSLRTFREVMADGSFGELFVRGNRPTQRDHVFASVQSLNSQDAYRSFDPEHFDVIIIDEFHHAEATTYQRLIDYFRPRELLGLTATPERADGTTVTRFFDGRIATEMRLWDALDAEILVPFHYFAIADNSDLSQITFRRGRYDETELSALYTGNTARVRLIIQALHNTLRDLSTMIGLGFCVSVEHARFMANSFTDAGIPADVIVGDTPDAERARRVAQLREGQLRILFVVDVFNEGVDIPEVNTILFLRPTESSTIFLQQLGRGLRRSPQKAVLTVLDFVGNQNANYRFDTTLRALTGGRRSRRRLTEDIEKGFPYLPSGSQIVLDRATQEQVLRNISSHLRLNATQLAQDVMAHLDSRKLWNYRIADYLHEADLSLEDIYRSSGTKRTWSTVRRTAAQNTGIDLAYPPDQIDETTAVMRLAHVNDTLRADTYRRLMREPLRYQNLSAVEQRWARMLYFTLLHPQIAKRESFTSFDEGFDWLRSQRALVDEADQLFEHVVSEARISPRLTGLGDEVPLYTQANYRRSEILAALDVSSWEKPFASHVSGVEFSQAFATDILLINLKKSERDFSPTTMYHDYAISQRTFHWETQSRAHPDSGDGQRYITKDTNNTHTMLFVREAPQGAFAAQPFMCLGTADLESWSGSKPMQIVWNLHEPMPAEWFRKASAVA